MNSFQKIYALISGIILLAAVFVAVLILPIFEGVAQDSRRFNTINQEGVKVGAQIAAIDEYKKISKDIKEKLSDIEEMLVDPKFPVEFVSFLEQLASQNSVIVSVSSRGSSDDIDKRVTFQVAAIGNFYDIMKFVSKLEVAPYLVQIQEVKMQKVEKQDFLDEENKIQANLVLTVLAK